MAEVYQTSGEMELELRERFAVREETFVHRHCRLNLILPKSAEDLLDEEAFEKDERMPYWADLWPSARALARHLLNTAPLHGRVVELGCGVGLPSLAVLSRGGDVLATDHNADALLFAHVNAHRNNLGELPTALLDWREQQPSVGRFDAAIAADVLYEQRNAVALVELLPRILKPEGKFFLADPGRRWADEFARRMRAAGWNELDAFVLEEPQTGGGPPSMIRISAYSLQ